MQDKKYFSRSWSMLTRDRGWFKPLLVMAAANLVPIAGALGNKGYGLEWARLTAWGVDSAPKQKGVAVGKCIGSGWRGFVVDLVWGLIYLVATLIIGAIGSIFPGMLGDLIGSLLSLATMLVSVVFGIVIMVAEVRAAIYESIGAGLKFGTVFQMIKRDTDGFFRVVLINLVGTIIVMVAMFFATLLFMIMFMPAVLQLMTNDVSSYALAATLATSIAVALPLIIIVGYAISFVVEGLKLIVINAVGLWMRQFNVPEWGRSEDPLPSAEQTGPQGYGYAENTNEQPMGYSVSQQEPEQVVAPQPVSEPAPEFVPAPVPVSTPAPEPAPEPEFAPVTVPEPEPVLAPEPEPEFVSELDSEPEAGPVPEPVSEFVSEPAMAPESAPVPEPVFESAPEVDVEDADKTTQILSATQTLPIDAQETTVIALDATTELPRNEPNIVEETPAKPESAESEDDQTHVEELYQEFLEVVESNDLSDDE